MAKTQHTTLSAHGWRTAVFILCAALGLGVVAVPASAAVDCATVLGGSPADPTDTDNDGLTDYQECVGVTLADATVIPTCGIPRSACLDPNTKDVFVIFAPAPPPNSLLPARPFDEHTVYGLTFTGLSGLGVTVHQVSPGQAAADRTIVGSQKAVQIAENLDTSGSILGYCNWGTPNGLDGCVVYTQRIKSFVYATCGTRDVITAARDPSNRDAVALAYSIRTVLHETGHSLGGLAPTYDSRSGGYHYTSGTIMEQFATYSAKKTCKFNIAPEWNLTLDPPAVKLK
jgi:hypothetical protein